MLKIRLTRVGKKHQPSYRIVVTPKENPVQGQYLELLGTYNPIKGDVKIDTDKALGWLNKGAQPSERLARLLDKAGLKHKSIVIKTYAPKPKEVTKKEAKEAPASPEAATNEEVEEVTPEPVAEAEIVTETSEETAEESKE